MIFGDYVELKGVPGSPYTRKMLALLRYRRIPYRLIQRARFQIDRDLARFPEKPTPKIELLPTFYCLNEQGEEIAVCDTTPVIRRLEEAFQGRCTVPNTAVLGFLNDLIEDYADEWLTKAMFHYRWNYPADIKKAGQMLPRWGNSTADEALLQRRSGEVRSHQISRLSYVGSNESTKNVIESSFKRFLQILDKHLETLPFVLGERPSSCDFAVFGQLTCMALFDPTPQSIILDKHPRIHAWVECMEDLSGYELLDDDWLNENELPETLKELLTEIGRVYAPYLAANGQATQLKHKQFSCEIDGSLWQQNTFPYQAKCLQWLKQHFQSLDSDAKARIALLFEHTGNDLIIA